MLQNGKYNVNIAATAKNETGRCPSNSTAWTSLHVFGLNLKNTDGWDDLLELSSYESAPCLMTALGCGPGKLHKT